jgi:hypothetical protein
LLRARRERPRGCGAADERDEVAAPHSITSSAQARSDGVECRAQLRVSWPTGGVMISRAIFNGVMAAQSGAENVS